MTSQVDHRSLELRLLGPLEARVDDRPVTLTGTRRRALLIRLALSANEVVSKDRLIDDLWGETPPPTAAKSLQVQVSQLRDALRLGNGGLASKDEVLVTAPSGYMLMLDPKSLDTSRFERSYEAARQALALRRYAEAGAFCRSALSLWRGPALDDVAREPFALAEVTRLEELRLAVIEMRIEADLAQPGRVEIIGELETLVARHPLREHLWWLLALALYRSGRQAEALRACTRLRELLRDELGLAPSLEIASLEHQIIVQDPALERECDPAELSPRPAGRAFHTNVPRATTQYVGGDAILEEIADQLRLGRVVTLTGTGGVGKTRAATEFCRGQFSEFRDGVYFVDLAPIADADAVVGALASVLPFVAVGERSLLESVVDWVGERHLLLVLDNCEHLVTEVAVLVEELVTQCWNVRILATSREPIRVHGERVYRVPSLAADGAALELFCERARAADATFRADGHRETLIQICERLDGIPLAIELAAARVPSLSVEHLLERLHDRFHLLRGTGRSQRDRHQTLQATVSWSYQLLSDTERLLFDRLSVFAGEFDLIASEAVCGFDPIDRADVLDLVSSLVDKSMIMVIRGPEVMRYRLLETLRQFGLQQLDSRGERTRVGDLHASYYARLAAELDVLVRGARQVEGEAQMALEWDNIRASHVWSFEQGDLERTERIADATFQYAAFSMRYENAAMLERAVQLGDECGRPSTHMFGLLSYWADMQGDQVEGRRLAQRGLDVAPSPDHSSTASCWWMLAGASSADVLTPADARAAFQHQAAAVANTPDLEHNWLALVCLADASLNADFGSMPKLLEQLRDLAARVQCPRLALSLHEHEGHAFLRATPPDFAAATIAYGQFAAISEATGDRQSSARALRCLAMASTGLGAPDALARCHDAVERLYDIRHWQKVWQTAESVALALAQAGRLEEAAAILGRLGVRPRGSGMEHGLHFGDRARQLVDAHGGCSDAMTRGARMSVDEFIVAALAYCAEV